MKNNRFEVYLIEIHLCEIVLYTYCKTSFVKKMEYLKVCKKTLIGTVFTEMLKLQKQIWFVYVSMYIYTHVWRNFST